ncbi:MarR family winged helix-turn-helix transcriptional regulator [Monaibacterium marinum]|nr:MarR family winged helix-turn-helix transcriptional regulator [Monaibacterium marinum]
MHFLLHASDLVEDKLRRRLNELDLHPRQARVLDALSRMEPTSQVELARAFDVTAASMSTMTVRLMAAGLITRQVDPDQARSNVLRLTPQGTELLDTIHQAWRSIDDEIAELIGPEDAATLAALTRKLRNSLGGSAPGMKQAKTASNS